MSPTEFVFMEYSSYSLQHTNICLGFFSDFYKLFIFKTSNLK